MVQVAAMRMPSHLLLAAAVVAVVAVCSGRCEGAEPGLQCKLETGVIIGAGNIDVLQVASADACCNACNANSACIAFTFDTSTHACFLKDNLRDNTTQSDRISGTNGRSPNDVFYACQGKFGSLRFCNTSLPLDARLQDLISRVKLDDVGAQLRARQSPQLLDIGVPAYYWGTNAIHGMQNTQCLPDGQCPTSFPAPCGLAATFNMSIVKEMGRIIGRELRAYYNGQFHNSLDTWSPTINPSRDPRWGRNVESPGEDPLVCGLYGSAYTQGLQYGDDPNYYQAIVTLKHWVAYSVENYNGVPRHTYNAKVSAYDLADTYLPGWERTIKDAGAMGVMCSYNELNGAPTCGNPNLTAILREDWGFKGYMTSDSDAVADICNSHHFEPTLEKAVRDAINAGCDINSGNTYADHLANAVRQGLLNMSAVNACQARAYKMRFLTGLFDPNVTTSYRHINTTEVGWPPSQHASLVAARKTMTLLKNDDNTLPFSVGRRVAVLGVSANSSSDILGNYVGPICRSGGFGCVPTIFDGIASYNKGGHTTLVADPSKVDEAVAAAKDADYVVLLASNAKDGGGEGHDRYNISLAQDQQLFAEAVLKVGKPTVLLSINGGLISFDRLKHAAPAILLAFMPGVHGAQAVAETIFGANNPGGKLPVTMYPSTYVDDIDFLNMSMTTGPGRSYKYYTGTPLFAFGFGLSYTTFNLTWSPAPPSGVLTSPHATKTYTCKVTNTGRVAGDEVVFAFMKPKAATITTLGSDTPVPIKVLFAFERVSLAAGASTTVHFNLTTTMLGLVDNDGHRSVHNGDYDVELTRGHGEELLTTVTVALPAASHPHRISTFRKWW